MSHVVNRIHQRLHMTFWKYVTSQTTLFYVDIRIAGNAEKAFFLNRLFAKDAGRKVQHQLFGKCKLRFAVFFYNVHPFHLAGNGNDAKALPCRVVVPNHYGMFAENTVDPDLFVNEMSGSGIYVHTPEFNTECEILELLRRAENG